MKAMDMLKKTLGSAVLGSTLFLTSGCAFTSVKIPLDIDLDKTQLGSKTGESSFRSILGLITWGDAGTQAAAQDGGITTLLHADQKIFNLFWIYYRQTTVVYGD